MDKKTLICFGLPVFSAYFAAGTSAVWCLISLWMNFFIKGEVVGIYWVFINYYSLFWPIVILFLLSFFFCFCSLILLLITSAMSSVETKNWVALFKGGIALVLYVFLFLNGIWVNGSKELEHISTYAVNGQVYHEAAWFNIAGEEELLFQCDQFGFICHKYSVLRVIR